MSRIEKHKERREGGITINQDKLNEEVDKKTNKVEPKKSPVTSKAVVENKPVQAVKRINKENKRELFDIEDVFQNLKRTNLAPDHDTQLEIIKEILSGNTSEYDDVNFEIDKKTNRIKISEEELTKLLKEREKRQSRLEKNKEKTAVTPVIPKEIKTRKNKNTFSKPKSKKNKLLWLYYIIIIVLFVVFFAFVLIFFF